MERHVHPPHADLVIIASIEGSLRALHTVREILWLLGSDRFDGPLDDDLELLGEHGSQSAATTASGTAFPAAREQDDGHKTKRGSELLRGVKHAMRKPKRGVVLCLPRRKLQGWLLREGRARIAGTLDNDCGGGSGSKNSRLWQPSWVEDGIDVVPPALPGLAPAQDEGDGDAGSDRLTSGSPVELRGEERAPSLSYFNE